MLLLCHGAVAHNVPPVMRGERPAIDPDAALHEDLDDASRPRPKNAAITLAWFGDRLPVELKPDATPVTEVDRAAEQAIRSVLAERAPGDGILGEEGGDTPGKTGRTWVIDPVDGTRLYAEGIPLWTTLIALRVDGLPVLGVADAPALSARYHAGAAAATGAASGACPCPRSTPSATPSSVTPPSTSGHAPATTGICCGSPARPGTHAG